MSAFTGFVRKEVFHVLRDKQTLLILLGMPLVQVLLFGFAVRTDVSSIRVAVVDPTPSVATRQLTDRIAASERFELQGVFPTLREIEGRFSNAALRQAIVLPPNAERLMRGSEPLQIQIVTDAADPNTGSIMQAYAGAIVRQWYSESAGSGAAGNRLRIDIAARMRYNPTLESVNLFVPGLIALILTIVSAMMTAISITREKETGTMEMLLVSPLRPLQIVAGKVAPYIVLAFVDVLLVLGAARTVFHMPLRGNLALLLGECLLYIVTALALGIVISINAQTQRAAMLAALAGLLMPTLMLSGFIFPLDSLPAPLQVLSHVVPARWFLLIVRGIMVKGAGIASLWKETLILLGITLVLLVAGSKRLAIRLD
ncbi:MAG: ABC transporter permease [Gemmatimonadaceae bacterium]